MAKKKANTKRNKSKAAKKGINQKEVEKDKNSELPQNLMEEQKAPALPKKSTKRKLSHEKTHKDKSQQSGKKRTREEAKWVLYSYVFSRFYWMIILLCLFQIFNCRNLANI